MALIELSGHMQMVTVSGTFAGRTRLTVQRFLFSCHYAAAALAGPGTVTPAAGETHTYVARTTQIAYL